MFKPILSILRWLPFIGLGAASIWASARTSEGYRDWEFDWDISPPALLNALTKLPHITSMAMLFLLAIVAVGPRRAGWAAGMTLLIGIAWELVQMPTKGNNPRLADLAPDLVGIGLAWALVAVAGWLIGKLRQRQPTA